MTILHSMLLTIVVAALVLALVVDIGAAIGRIRRRWR